MGMIISMLCLYSAVCFHTSVGFLLFYLIWWAMRRPLLVNNQRRSALFLYTYYYVYGICMRNMCVCMRCICARTKDTIIAYKATMEKASINVEIYTEKNTKAYD